MSDHDQTLAAFYAPVRDISATQAELEGLHHTLTSGPPKRHRRRLAIACVSAACLIPAAAIAADPLGDALDSFLDLADGTPIELGPGTIVDRNRDVTFKVTRSAPDDVCLSADRAVMLCGDPRDGSWQDQLEDRAVAPLGTIAPRSKSAPLVPLFVLAAPGVERLELTYRHGPPTKRQVGNGGAVLLVDASRGPSELVAINGAGQQRGRVDVSDRQWTWCRDTDDCPENR